MLDESELLGDEYDESCFMHSRCFFFLSRRFLFESLYLLSSDESDSLYDESDELGSDSGSSGTYSFHAFSLRFDESIGIVSVLGSEVFAPTGFESKVGQKLEMFWRSNSLFSFLILKLVL